MTLAETFTYATLGKGTHSDRWFWPMISKSDAELPSKTISSHTLVEARVIPAFRSPHQQVIWAAVHSVSRRNSLQSTTETNLTRGSLTQLTDFRALRSEASEVTLETMPNLSWLEFLDIRWIVPLAAAILLPVALLRFQQRRSDTLEEAASNHARLYSILDRAHFTN